MWLALSMILAAAPADGGTRLVATDGGVPDAPKPARPAGGELEALKKRVTELEARTAELERQVKQVDALAKKLDQATDDLEALKRDADERKQAEQQAAERKQRSEAVARGLAAADEQLASGNTNIEASLRAAEATYTGAALELVRAARQALANGDVASARRYLALAVSVAWQAR
jgi:predicted RNase H-like nuclease (RuvC/YqgF family)